MKNENVAVSSNNLRNLSESEKVQCSLKKDAKNAPNAGNRFF